MPNIAGISLLWTLILYFSLRSSTNHPRTDQYGEDLSSSTSSSQPHHYYDELIVSGTYQSYLTRQPTLLLTAIRHAETHGYALGVKLVRGAYFVQEREKWKKEKREGPDPIWPE